MLSAALLGPAPRRGRWIYVWAASSPKCVAANSQAGFFTIPPSKPLLLMAAHFLSGPKSPPGIFDPGGYFKTAPLPQIPSLFAGEHHRLPCAGFFFACDEDDLHMGNPRYANGSLRRKHRARLCAMRCECGICHGRFGPIHYDEPSDAAHPLSFVIDEIRPVSKWRQGGYPSARAAAEDWNNLQAAHYFCNAQKGNKTAQNEQKSPKKLTKAPTVRDGDW